MNDKDRLPLWIVAAFDVRMQKGEPIHYHPQSHDGRWEHIEALSLHVDLADGFIARIFGLQFHSTMLPMTTI